MQDLFLQYKKEREDVESIQVEGAFITFKMFPDHVYIEDVYCIPELRGSNIIYELAEKVEKAAKAADYKKMLVSVDIKANNPEIGLKSSFKNGYKIKSLQGSVIWLEKELG